MIKISIIGLGYVGLPLCLNISKKYETIGYDINQLRISALSNHEDKNNEFKKTDFKNRKISFTNKISDISKCNLYIICVPTPITKDKKPDLNPIKKSFNSLSKILKKGDIIILESTVYPGVTKKFTKFLEQKTKLKNNRDFYVCYSSERINPGDKEHTVEKILKVTSGSNPEIAVKIDDLYKSVIAAGTHLAPTIKVAEASKVIENSQRDINIAFVNELAKIFNLLDINTHDVLEAAGTKWNFLPFKPGLVGGHCIGVDPYYLAQKAQEHGYHPEIILAGRRLNDGMGDYVASEVVKCMIKKNVNINDSNTLILGITFKENCPDVRNTKAVDVVNALKSYGTNITIYDPWANEEEVMHEYGMKSSNIIPDTKFDAVVLTVAHNEFKDLDFSLLTKDNSVIYDVKNIIPKYLSDKTL